VKEKAKGGAVAKRSKSRRKRESRSKEKRDRALATYFEKNFGEREEGEKE